MSERAQRGRDEEERPLEGGELLPLLVVVVLTGWAWAPALAMPFSGEDYFLLGRLNQGLVASPHLFRPLLGGWLVLMHDLFGVESPAPYHAGALLLHLANTTLVFLLGRRLLRSRYAAAGVAAAFGLGAGALDALTWIAAVNRPLSSFGALLALNGLVRVGSRGALGITLCAVGLLWQFGTNEEFYGTAALAVVWLGALAWRRRDVRWLAAGTALLPVALLAIHYFVLHPMSGDAGSIVESGLPRVFDSVRVRAEALAMGWGLDAAFAFVLPLGGAFLFLVARRFEAGAFAFLAWGASLVPFALSDAIGYRFYPTQAPTALLAVGGIFALAARLVPREGRRRLERRLFFVALVAVFLATRMPRQWRWELWQEVLQEIEACVEPARAFAERVPEPVPVCANIESTTPGLVYYAWDVVEYTDVTWVGFLDAASAYVPLPNPPPGPWFGRRCEGSYGPIEPQTYFAQRPTIDAVRLYDGAVQAASLEEARALLADASVDLTRSVVAEAPDGLLADFAAAGEQAPGTLEVLEPFASEGPFQGSMRVRVRCARPVVLAYQDHWLFDPTMRYPPDHEIFSGIHTLRPFRLKASDGGGEALATFPVNAFGLGVLIPAGEREVQLDFSRLTARELRAD